jgi:hypothetical protein
MACGLFEPIGSLQLCFRDYFLHRDISSLFRLARLSRLRINHVVAAMTARLDTGPVASSYPGTPSLERAALPCRNQTFNTGSLWARFLGDDSRLTAVYERVCIGAADTKWKPNENIASSDDTLVNVTR